MTLYRVLIVNQAGIVIDRETFSDYNSAWVWGLLRSVQENAEYQLSSTVFTHEN